MKKFVLFSIAMLVGVASFAQKKGEMYIGGFLAGEFGNVKTISTADGTSQTSSMPADAANLIGVQYGYFAANNLRLSLALASSFTSTPYADPGFDNAKAKLIFAYVNPSVAYYVKLADRFYYAPEAGVMFGLGKAKYPVSSTDVTVSDIDAWSAYLDFAAFDFRVSDKFAVGVSFGYAGYESYKYDFVDYGSTSQLNSFSFNFNTAEVTFKWYL